MGEGRRIYMFLVGKPEGKRPRGQNDKDGRIILRRMLRKLDVLGVLTGLSWLRIETGSGPL
jgi:hypothetical protein